ncbi:MAG: ThiF family adenylyltransferase [Opitutaceae bacterium]|nr:ThiF family adenylyltransferase [Opitutaceae bacterium]
MSSDRYERSIRLFGKEGQDKLRATRAVVVGVSGLGSPLVQHLALLGIAHITLVEPEELDDTNRNRFVGARADDPVPGSPKTMLAARLIRETNPDVGVLPLQQGLVSVEAFAAIRQTDWVFGCLDHDGPRFVLNELCSAYEKVYLDMASDVVVGGAYGGRVCVADGRNGCLVCRDLLDFDDVRHWLESPEDQAVREAIYGVNREVLDGRGPSVAPLNGVIASLGAMEFMVGVTGMRRSRGCLNYRAHMATVSDATALERKAYCPYCADRGNAAAFDPERYLRMSHLLT